MCRLINAHKEDIYRCKVKRFKPYEVVLVLGVTHTDCLFLKTGKCPIYEKFDDIIRVIDIFFASGDEKACIDLLEELEKEEGANFGCQGTQVNGKNCICILKELAENRFIQREGEFPDVGQSEEDQSFSASNGQHRVCIASILQMDIMVNKDYYADLGDMNCGNVIVEKGIPRLGNNYEWYG